MNFRTCAAGIILSLLATSCIQDEVPNVEAAIDGCTGANIQLANIDATHKEIEIYVLDGTDVSRQELNFTLADGATIQADEQEAGDQPPYYDFSQRTLRRFTVTSEDGNTQATYVVRINKMELPTHYSFENLRATTPFHIFYLTNESGIMQWASGNPGYELSGMALNETEYPTVQSPIGYSGKSVLQPETYSSARSMYKMLSWIRLEPHVSAFLSPKCPYALPDGINTKKEKSLPTKTRMW